MAGQTITVKMAFERSTKGAVRFQEVTNDGTPINIADGAKIGTLYIRKSALDGTEPKSLSITIQPQG